ncbi:hypothetical protein, partial [Sphingomonas sp. PB4P5]|uniref:hypothetical protein n=1 Tax=Parasphingomonas puruogangriensis TaxID=3096155 RepID=UPI002FC849F4
RQEKLLPPIATFDETPHHRPPKSDHDHSISARFHTASTTFRRSGRAEAIKPPKSRPAANGVKSGRAGIAH